MPDTLDGLISFFASHHAVRAEKVMRSTGMAAVLIPGPKDLSPNCGVALRFEYAQREAALGLLADRKVRVDQVHRYRPRIDEWTTPSPRRGIWRRGWR